MKHNLYLVFSILTAVLTLGSHAHAQSNLQPVVEVVNEWLPGTIQDDHKGDKLRVKCFEKTDGRCTKFQFVYFYSYNDQAGAGPVLSETVLLERIARLKKDPGENFFNSKLFYLSSEAKDVTWQARDENGKPSHFASTVARETFRKNRYTSDGVYALQVAGAVPATALAYSGLTVVTVAVTAADVAVWPIRGIGNLLYRVFPERDGSNEYRRYRRKALRKVDLLSKSDRVYKVSDGSLYELYLNFSILAASDL